MSQELRVALVAALAALLGTIIGGFVGYYTNRSLQDHQFTRDESQRLRQAKSAASLERYRFDAAKSTLAPMLSKGGIASPIPTELEAQVNGADQQLVVSYLSQKGIQQYADGRLCVNLLMRELPKDNPRPVHAYQVGLYRSWDRCIDDAERAIAKVATRSAP
jgi:hypothetical protein